MLIDMLPFTDDIHKRSASFITVCQSLTQHLYSYVQSLSLIFL